MSPCRHAYITTHTPISAIAPRNQLHITSSTLPSWTLDRAPRFRLLVWTASRQVTGHVVRERQHSPQKKGERKKGDVPQGNTTHPIIIEHASLNLVQNVPRCIFESAIHVVS